jgi:hypothetical protein
MNDLYLVPTRLKVVRVLVHDFDTADGAERRYRKDEDDTQRC